MNKNNLDKFITEALAIEEMHAKEFGTLGYMARALVQATMPHKNPGKDKVWGRKNGNFSMLMQPGFRMGKNNIPESIGLPYGTKPRLVLAFIASEAVKNGNPEIILGRSLSAFMSELGLHPTGGRWGTIFMLREQMKRLFSATISFSYDEKPAEIERGFRVASKSVLFWDSKSPSQGTLWESTVTLTQEFFEEIINHPVPIDMRALSALKSSSLAIDIYCWLTYRFSYLKSRTKIPWELLSRQFGSEYSEIRDFRKSFIKQMKKVLAIYDVNIQEEKSGLVLNPSNTHIAKKVQKLPTNKSQ